MKIKYKLSDGIFDFIVYGSLFLLALMTLLPFMQVLTISLSTSEIFMKPGLHLWPTSLSFAGYKQVFSYPLIWISYKNTIIRTIIGTCLSLVLYVLAAYPLSKTYLPNRKFWTIFVIFTMYFQGGLIPQYILQANVLHMKDTWSVLLLPMAVTAYSLIIVRNFFMSIPESLIESAKIDGASDFYTLVKIVLPLSKPILATVSLWTAVWHWNQWFDYLLYIGNKNMYGLQHVLRRILIEGTLDEFEKYNLTNTEAFVNTETMKMSMLIVTIAPIICVYPFIQKYFVKGIRMGAVKG